MRKLVFCIICLAGVLIMMESCNSKEKKKDSEKEELAPKNKNDKETKKTEEAYNESIQGTFFGVSFGAGRDEVIEKFTQRGFSMIDNFCTDVDLYFHPANSLKYSFGDMSWHVINVAMSKARFYGIEFYSSFEDKEEAIGYFKTVFSKVSKKYKLAKAKPGDSNTYFVYKGNSRKEPDRCVYVYVSRYEAVGNNIRYGVFLSYYDYAYETELSDEL